ncbi:hypothetical protein D3C76_1107190 [compost metagenome]
MQGEGAAGAGFGEVLQRRHPFARHADAVEIGAGYRLRGGEQPLRAVDMGIRQWLAKALHQPSGNGHRRLHRHLLADDGAHCLLERIEGGGQAQAGMAGQQRLQQRVGAQMLGDLLWVGVEVEHAPYPCLQRLRMTDGLRLEVQLQLQGGFVVQRTHAEPAGMAVHTHAATVAARLQAFDAGKGAQGEVFVELLPVPGGEIGQAQGLWHRHFVHGRTITAAWPPVLPQLTFKFAGFDL